MSLLERLRALIERTYDLETGIARLSDYVIGDGGLRRLYGLEPPPVGAAVGVGSRVIVRERPEGVGLVLYYPDALVRHLEIHDPRGRLDSGNVDAFAALVEELDHLLVLAARARRGEQTSLLELEIHANVTKELVLRHFLGRRLGVRTLPGEISRWIRFHLFDKVRFAEGEPGSRRRYEEARVLSVRLLDAMARLPAVERIAALRRLDRAGAPRLARGLLPAA